MEFRRATHRPSALLAPVLIVMTLAVSAQSGSAFSEDAHHGSSEGRSRPARQVGLASFYGPGFQGQETASGEDFDMRQMVAAHRTLPLGSVVRVTNLENGRSIVVRVIDRGPYGKNYRKGTIIDVSKGAARRLRFLRDGLAWVRIDVLKEGHNTRQ